MTGEEQRRGVRDWDAITLSGLKAVGNHGVYDFERAGSQDFIADIILYVDARKAARTDDVADTVDYSAVAEDAVAVLTGPAVFLIETLASRLAEIALSYPGVKRAAVTVHKPMAPLKQQFSDVSVTVVRERKGQVEVPAEVGGGTTGAGESLRDQDHLRVRRAEVSPRSHVQPPSMDTRAKSSRALPKPASSPLPSIPSSVSAAEPPRELAVTQLDAPKPPTPAESRPAGAGRRRTRRGPSYSDPNRPANVVYDVVLALGANRGDTVATLRGAVEALAALEGFDVQAVSPLVRTEPVLEKGALPQDDYMNAIVLGQTVLAPPALLAAIQKIESDFGRVRVSRWGARTLDIDIIALDQMRLQTSRLTLPHPRAWSRAFVLYPWFQVDPAAHLAGAGYIKDLLGHAADLSGLLMEYPDWLEGDAHGGPGMAVPLELAPRREGTTESPYAKQPVKNAVIRGQQVELLGIEGDLLFRALMESESDAPDQTSSRPRTRRRSGGQHAVVPEQAKTPTPLPSRRSLHAPKQSDAAQPEPTAAVEPHQDLPEPVHPSGTIPVVARNTTKEAAPTENRRGPRHGRPSQPSAESLPQWDYFSRPQTKRVVDAIDAPDPSLVATAQIPRVSRNVTVRPTPTGSIPVRQVRNTTAQD